MTPAIRHANAAVEFGTLHRSGDSECAALTLRLRDTGDRERALVVEVELPEHGQIDRAIITTRRVSG